MTAGGDEWFDRIDEAGRVIGTVRRRDCHGNPELLHRTAHVVVFHPDGKRILLQRRCRTKDVQPGKWDTAVGGHLDHQEDYESAARREMSEELGLSPSLPLDFLFDSKIRNTVESENVRVYGVVSEGPFQFQESEIDEIRFWSRKEIGSAENSIFTPNLLLELKELERRALF